MTPVTFSTILLPSKFVFPKGSITTAEKEFGGAGGNIAGNSIGASACSFHPMMALQPGEKPYPVTHRFHRQTKPSASQKQI